MKISRILIGIDDSKYAEYATSYGFDLAKTFNAHVALVHIVEPAVTPDTGSGADNLMGMPLPTADYNDVTVMDIQREHADNIIHHVIEKYGKGLEITHFNEFGSTADGILNCSEEFKADLIVIGTHSRTGIDRLLMGSVAEKVIRNAKIPVMVVPHGEKD